MSDSIKAEAYVSKHRYDGLPPLALSRIAVQDVLGLFDI